jgi:hypothetical protein
MSRHFDVKTKFFRFARRNETMTERKFRRDSLVDIGTKRVHSSLIARLVCAEGG